MVDDLVLLGLHEEAAAYANRPAAQFELWPEHETIWNVFVALETQWSLVVLSNIEKSLVRYKGIEYDKVISTLLLMGIKKREWPEIFQGLRIMERAALSVMNE